MKANGENFNIMNDLNNLPTNMYKDYVFPAKMYHVSSKENKDSILKKGLLINAGKKYGAKGVRKYKPAVYLTTDWKALLNLDKNLGTRSSILFAVNIIPYLDVIERDDFYDKFDKDKTWARHGEQQRCYLSWKVNKTVKPDDITFVGAIAGPPWSLVDCVDTPDNLKEELSLFLQRGSIGVFGNVGIYTE